MVKFGAQNKEYRRIKFVQREQAWNKSTNPGDNARSPCRWEHQTRITDVAFLFHKGKGMYQYWCLPSQSPSCFKLFVFQFSLSSVHKNITQTTAQKQFLSKIRFAQADGKLHWPRPSGCTQVLVASGWPEDGKGLSYFPSRNHTTHQHGCDLFVSHHLLPFWTRLITVENEHHTRRISPARAFWNLLCEILFSFPSHKLENCFLQHRCRSLHTTTITSGLGLNLPIHQQQRHYINPKTNEKCAVL